MEGSGMAGDCYSPGLPATPTSCHVHGLWSWLSQQEPWGQSGVRRLVATGPHA